MGDRPFDPLDVSAPEFWAQPARARDEHFAELRQERPISWHRTPRSGLASEGGRAASGFWAVVRHVDVVEASRDSDTFCNGQGVGMVGVPPEISEMTGSILLMDAPRHTLYRRLISRAFSPRQVRRIEGQIQRQARAIVDELVQLEECDFVEQVSKRLPMWTIAEMIGIPDDHREEIAATSYVILTADDPEQMTGDDTLTRVFAALLTLLEFAKDLAGHRRRHPTDDLMSALVAAEVDGHSLTDGEIAAFFMLLNSAGNDTTKNTITHGMKALCDFPDQRQLLLHSLPEPMHSAWEEMFRWATPVHHFRRTAVRPTVLGGQPIDEGERIVLFYTSANRDDRVFDDPWSFDLLRLPNPHVAFGGGGIHYCIGAHLARAQTRSLFTELLARAPRLEVGRPEPLQSNFVHGVRRLPCVVDPG